MESGRKKRMYITENDNKRTRIQSDRSKIIQPYGTKIQHAEVLEKITPFESRILGAYGLALSGFVGMTVLNNWYSQKEEYVNYLLKLINLAMMMSNLKKS